MIFSWDEWPGGTNLASTPAVWDEMFSIVAVRAVRAQPRPVAPRVADGRLRAGRPRLRVADPPRPREGHGDRPRRALPPRVRVAGHGLAGAAAPGLGEVDWDRFIAAAVRVGYDGVVSVEHEDRAFERTEELVKRGFLIARDVLRPHLH